MVGKLKVALFGAAGQVGTDCGQALIDKGYDVSLFTRSDVDFSIPEMVADKILNLKPSLVINACAYTAVDKAQEESELADLVNHQSVAAMADACFQLSIPLIHLSTDYVFDGTADAPYQEDDLVKPLGVYGATKLAGEQAVQQTMSQYVILRTSWVFGKHGNNFVKTMLRVGAGREQLSVVDDQYGRPTYVGDIVTAILFFVNQYEKKNSLPSGIYHCSSEGETTWHGFAQAIFDMAVQCGAIEKKPQVIPISTSEYPTPAPRPAYSVLSTEKLMKTMGSPMPHWQQGLAHFLKHI